MDFNRNKRSKSKLRADFCRKRRSDGAVIVCLERQVDLFRHRISSPAAAWNMKML
jgi:hypothetical protein